MLYTSEQHRSSQKKEKFAFLGFMPKLYYPFPFFPWPCQGRHTQISVQSRLARNHSGDQYFYYHSEPSWLMKNERRSACMPLLLIYHQLNIRTNAMLFVGSWHHNPPYSTITSVTSTETHMETTDENSSEKYGSSKEDWYWRGCWAEHEADMHWQVSGCRV